MHLKHFLSGLSHHPFSVAAFFDYSVVLTFAVPKELLEDMIPKCLTLDTLHDDLAFIAVAAVKTKALRPEGFPKFTGKDFFLIGYRIFVRYTSESGKKMRGLYILRSATDSRLMKMAGNLVTQYRYDFIRVRASHLNGLYRIDCRPGGFSLTAAVASQEASLPDGSPFKDWKEARKFAGPMPFTFSYDSARKEVLIIEGKRDYWQPKPLQIHSYKCIGLPIVANQITLASAFVVEQVPYTWRKGKIEKWHG